MMGSLGEFEFPMPRFFLLVDSCGVLRRGFSNQHRVRERDRSTGLTPQAHRSSISSPLFLCFFVDSSNTSTSLSWKGRTGGNMLYTHITPRTTCSFSGTWLFNLQIVSLQNFFLTLCALMTFHTYLKFLMDMPITQLIDLLPRRYFQEILKNLVGTKKFIIWNFGLDIQQIKIL
jgi:hypothetical protein